MVIETLTPQTPQVNDEFMTLSLNVDARADYHSIGRFLGRLESHNVFIRVLSLKVSARENDEASATEGLQVTMSLSVLYPVRGVLK